MSKEKILRIHIGKTGGGTIGTIINLNGLNKNIITKHGKGFSLSKDTPYKHIIISLRDPVEKFISAFNWRKGRMWYIDSVIRNKNTKSSTRNNCIKEKKYLEYFKVPNTMALAFSNKDKDKAVDAMSCIVHVARTIEMYVGGINTLEYLHEQGVKFYIIHTENLVKETQEVLKQVMKDAYNVTLKEIKTTTKKANPSVKNKTNTFMSIEGRNNLIKYLDEDIKCMNYLEKIKEKNINYENSMHINSME